MIVNGTEFTFPSSAEPWAGAGADSVNNPTLYPISLPNQGTITFTGSVPSGGSVDLLFRFVSFPTFETLKTDIVTVSGTEPNNYTVSIPFTGVYDEIALELKTRDVTVDITNVILSN
jgi:hypothetical protein